MSTNATENLFKNHSFTEETERELLTNYVHHHQFDNVPFEFFLAAKTDFIGTAKKMLSNFLSEKEIDEVLNANEAKLMLESECVKSLLSTPTDILTDTFLRDELNDKFTTLDEVVTTLIPVPEKHMGTEFHLKAFRTIAHAQLGMITLPKHLATSMSIIAAENMIPSERVSFFYRTTTGSIVFFNNDQLLFLNDGIKKELTETDNVLSNPDDEFWTTPLFQHLY